MEIGERKRTLLAVLRRDRERRLCQLNTTAERDCAFLVDLLAETEEALSLALTHINDIEQRRLARR
jgi:hypothetical protein